MIFREASWGRLAHGVFLLLLTLSACLLPRLQAEAAPSPVKTSDFTAAITHFQTSLGGSSHNVKFATVTIRFQNTTAKPLILSYIKGAGTITDDQGNRYLIWRDAAPHGIGEIAGKNVSSGFLLQPGESAESMMDFQWMPTRKDIQGTKYTLNFTVRRITLSGGSQYDLGPEVPLEFTGMTDGTWTADPASARVNNEGAFSAQVTQLRTSKSNSGNNPKHVLTATVEFKNLGTTPIILAYVKGSGLYIDNIGTRYDRDAENGHTAVGIGTTNGRAADPQFVLQPGETKTAQFQLWRFIFKNTAQIGDKDSLYLTLEQLEILPSKQIRTIRQYSLTFPELSAG